MPIPRDPDDITHDDHATPDPEAAHAIALRVVAWLRDGAPPGALDAANECDPDDAPTWVRG